MILLVDFQSHAQLRVLHVVPTHAGQFTEQRHELATFVVVGEGVRAEFLEALARLTITERDRLLKDAQAIREGRMPSSYQHMVAREGR